MATLLEGVTPHFGQYNVRSLGWAVGDRSVIVPYSYAGVPFPAGVHRDTVPLWNALLDGLTKQLGVKLMNPGCWGYNNRSITGGGSPSFHAVGLALDVNAPANPYVAGGGSTRHAIPDAAAGLARSLGMEWGGSWSSPKDYMHFEVHLTPDQVRTVVGRLTHPAPAPTPAPKGDDMTPEQDAMLREVRDNLRMIWEQLAGAGAKPGQFTGWPPFDGGSGAARTLVDYGRQADVDLKAIRAKLET